MLVYDENQGVLNEMGGGGDKEIYVKIFDSVSDQVSLMSQQLDSWATPHH